MSNIITDISGNGDQHKSASQRRELALRILVQEKTLLVEHLQSLVHLLLTSLGGSAVYPVESVRGNLGKKFGSTFNEEKTEITFTVKEEPHAAEEGIVKENGVV